MIQNVWTRLGISAIPDMIAEDAVNAEIRQTLNKHFLESVPRCFHYRIILAYTVKLCYELYVELLLLRWHWIARGRTP
jgi:hypothetical protein